MIALRHARELAHRVGEGNVREGTGDDAVDGLRPPLVVRPSAPEQVPLVLSYASLSGLAVVPRGGGTRIALGNAPSRLDLLLDVRGLDDLVAHEVEDLTVTVQAGVTLERLRAILGEAGQELRIEVPMPGEATAGGTVASAASGPSRFRGGTPRDLLIGMRAVLADGSQVKGGGRVVKNVAGYDLCKLVTGSFGTLAVLTELTFRLHPVPETAATLVAGYRAWEDLEAARGRLLASGLPWSFLDLVDRPLSARFADFGQWNLPEGLLALVVGIDGHIEDVDHLTRQAAELLAPRAQEAVVLAADLADGVRGLLAEASLLPGCAMTFRAAMPPKSLVSFVRQLERAGQSHNGSFATVARAGNGVAYAHFSSVAEVNRDALCWDLTGIAREFSAQLVLERAEPGLKAGIDVWDLRGVRKAEHRLSLAIKRKLDPLGTLCPGREPGAQA